MKLNIDGKSYDLTASVGGAALGDLLALKKHSGVTVNSIGDMFAWIGKQVSQPEFRPVDLLEDENFITNIIGVLWLAHRKAGDDITIADAEQTSFQSFYFEDDEDDDEVEADPKGESADESNATSA